MAPAKPSPIKKILFYFGHPAQFLFARQTLQNLKAKGFELIILIKSKDVLENLVKKSGMNYQNILSEGRKDSKAGILWGLFKRDFRLLSFLLKNRADLLVGTDPSLAHVGKLLRIPTVTTLEDDHDVIPLLAKTTYPYTRHILVPDVCKVGARFNKKKIGYNGYMKLGYLHPRYFTPNQNLAPQTDKPYILVRFAKLNAYHDDNISGLDESFIQKLLELTASRYKLLINSEYALPDRYSDLQLKVEPENIHHALYYSSLFVSDSQSMTMEAAMLGVPSVRYSDFAGRISVLEELEKKYHLTHSVKPPDKETLFSKINRLLNNPDLKIEYQEHRARMLKEKIDVTAMLTWFIENYPQSARMMQKDKSIQFILPKL